LITPLCIGGIYILWRYCFPAYNLCWGDYIRFKNGRERIGKGLISFFIVGLFSSIFYNYITALLGIGK
jgi:hypothetical protein